MAIECDPSLTDLFIASPHWYLFLPEISLRIAAIEYQFCQVKRMTRGSGGVMPSAYSQTLNGQELGVA